MQKKYVLSIIGTVCTIIYSNCSGKSHLLDSTRHHLRNGDPREWSEFPVDKESKLTLRFSATTNPSEQTLILRQYDVKLTWQVKLNNRALGSLIADEKDLINYFRIPPGLLQRENILEIQCKDPVPDDILAGPFFLDDRPLALVLSEAWLDLDVLEATTGTSIPSHITITNGEGTLQTVTGPAGEPLAVRAGSVYTGNGKASFSLPAGSYTLYAGRGFEYGIDSVKLTLKPGDYMHKQFLISREVSTPGWISSDTHIHTYTYSRHGDATLADRVLTIAGEGLELPISTDHNIFVDLKPFAVDNDVDSYFTSVTGDEVTTQVGHFNLFPAISEERVADHNAADWKTLRENMHVSPGQVVILNHARDIHLGFRPFDPGKHLSSAGMRLDDWELPANAMEVINSGSEQTDILELTRDWFGMLNAGHFLTPVGASDSHDVSRYIVGQARTYIRANDEDVAHIDVKEVVKNFLDGKVLVSLGLLTEMVVGDSYGPGDLVPAHDGILHANITVSGPAWTRADRIMLFANGKKIREERIDSNARVAGLKWRSSWDVPVPKHDIFLVAVAEGPGTGMPFWAIAKPYQPASPDWHPRVMGLTGAIWIDGDKNGVRNNANDYAKKEIGKSSGNISQLIKNLAEFDEAVNIQAAALLYKSGFNLDGPEVKKALRKASPDTKAGFQRVIEELSTRAK